MRTKLLLRKPEAPKRDYKKATEAGRRKSSADALLDANANASSSIYPEFAGVGG
jgi:hypothetical protein